MLTKVFIKNYVLIDELEIELSEGLNIITGETGAGKSLLINAIDIAFGAKAGKEVIKTGADKAVIEITIINKKQSLDDLFEKFGIDNIGEEIILSKEITPTASRSRVNGCLVNQEFIKILRELFLDIHSQHQTYSFIQPRYHITLLDSYAKNIYGTKLEDYQEKYAEYRGKLAELDKLRNTAQKTEEQLDFLKFQVREIEDADINDINEDEKLNNELSTLENVEKLRELTGTSYWSLSGDDSSIIETLLQIKSNLTKASNMDSSLEEIKDSYIEALESIKDISSVLRDYSSSLNNDEERINFIQERLFLLDKLKRKYGGTLEKVQQTGKQLRVELDNSEYSTQNIEKLEQEINKIHSDLNSQAQNISSLRKECAKTLSILIQQKLEKLELPKAKFDISFEQTELNANGFDKVEFLISTNVSEGLKPLAKVASGGEISRVMLAIKTIFAQNDNIDTVIFDEIDTGISGKTSQSVAEEVKELSNYMQIIMITHQAIIASKSNRHIYVKKSQTDSTSVSISILGGDEKLQAIAELAAGEINDDSLKFAQMLIN